MSTSEVTWDYISNQSFSLAPATTQLGWKWFQSQRFRTLNDGDFSSPTPYRLRVSEREGSLHCAFSVSYQRFVWQVGKWGEPSIAYGWTEQVPTSAPSPKTETISSADSTATYALSDKIRENFASWDILTDFAEMGETVRMLGMFYRQTSYLVQGYLRKSPALALKAFGFNPKYIRRLGRRKSKFYRPSVAALRDLIKSAPDPASFVSQVWLTWRYGLLPVVYSMEDALKAFESEIPNFTPEYTSQVTIPFVEDFPITTWYSDMPYGGRIDFSQIMGIGGSVRLRAKYSLRTDLLSRLGLTDWKSFAIAGYEVLLFSFVWDWFFDIGSALQLLHLRDMMTSCSINRTVIWKSYCSKSVQGLTLPTRASWMNPPNYFTDLQWTPIVNNLGTLSSRTFNFERTASTLTVPIPNLEFGINTLKRKLDAAALTYSAFKSSRTKDDWRRFVQRARNF